jgi:hypothetical protein
MSGQPHAEITLPVIKDDPDTEPDWDLVTFHCMLQLSMKAGLKRFGKQGKSAISKELNQLHL